MAKKKAPKKQAKQSKARKSKVTSRSKSAAIAKPTTRKSTAKKAPARARSRRSTEPTEKSTARIRQGVGLSEGGQSGDVQGLSGVEDVDSESVRELTEEGQDFEAGIVDAVAHAPDPDVSEVRAHEVPEDDLPEEYRNQNE